MQAILARLHVRVGTRYIAIVVGAGWVMALVLAAAGYLMLGTFLDGSPSELWVVVGVSTVASIPALGAGAVGSAEFLRSAYRWSADPASAALAPESWEAVEGSYKFVDRSALAMWVAHTFVLVWATVFLGAGVAAMPVAVVLGWAGVAAGWVIGTLTIPVALRPLFRAGVAILGTDPPEPSRLRPLRRRMLYVVPAAVFYSAYATGAFVLDLDSPEARLTTVLIVMTGVTLLFAGPVAVAARTSILDPVRDLISGTRRVTEGDFSAPVPVLTNDEFGALARSFNRMQRGLQEREALFAAVGSYIDPAVADRVVAGDARLAGEEVEVTVMFVDIVGFTTRAEGTDPAELVADLNEFFEIVIPAIERHHGHANKLLGDGLMAVFGVPRPLDDHADCALAAASEIISALHERYGDALRVGIGLNSGAVVVGSMGGGRKLDYTIIGDTVNVAARVEARTRETGDAILITESTRAQLTTEGTVEHRGRTSLRGREGEVELFAPARDDRPE
jgi:adenylate cyclase